MKRSLGLVLLVGMFAAMAFSVAKPQKVEAQRGTYYAYRLNQSRSWIGDYRITTNTFTALTTTGNTAAFDTSGALNHTIYLKVGGTAAASTCTFRLQGSLNNSDWYNISSSDINCATSSTVTFEAGKLAAYVRGSLLTFSGGTAPTLTLQYAGSGS